MHTRTRGGHQQKRARRTGEGDQAAQPSSRGALKDSPLGEALVLRWADGNLSATDVQHLAACAVASGATDPEVSYLASIGSAGTATGGNMSRQLYLTYCRDIGLCEPTIIEVPLKDVKTGQEIAVETAIHLPHDWMASMSEAYPAAFDDFFGASRIEEWWRTQRHANPKFWQHPMLDLPYHRTCLPVMLHGDAAEFQDRDSLNTISMKGLLLKETGGHCGHLLLASVPKCCTTPRTWPVIWQWLAWSFQALFAGKHPAADPLGHRWPRGSKRAGLAGSDIIASGLKAVLWSFCGDLDFYTKELHQPHHSSNHFCWRCAQDRSARPWNDFRPQARWRQTVYTGAELAATQQRHILFNSGIGFGLGMLMFDAMHVLDLGVTLYTIGSALYSIIYKDMDDADKKACFNRVWQRMQAISRDLGQERIITKFSLSQITDPDEPHAAYPCLRFVKAAEARHLARVIALLCQEFSSDSQVHAHRQLVMDSLVSIYDHIESHGWTLADSGNFSASVARFLQHYAALARQAMESGDLLWSITPKFHFLCHLAGQAEFEHPRLFWNYSGETFVGQVSRVAHMCLPGNAAHKISLKLLNRMRIALHLRLASRHEPAAYLHKIEILIFRQHA